MSRSEPARVPVMLEKESLAAVSVSEPEVTAARTGVSLTPVMLMVKPVVVVLSEPSETVKVKESEALAVSALMAEALGV